MDLKRLLKRSWGIRFYLYNPYIRELRIWHREQHQFYNDAKMRFCSEKPRHGTLSDYRKALAKHRVTYAEYMYSYEYWRLDEPEREKFISTSEMQCIYRKLGDRNVREIFHDKVQFLTLFEKFIYRKWAQAKDLTLDQFMAMATQFDCIAKPIDGTRGFGIFKICHNDVINCRELYQKCVDGNFLIEECISACGELAEFHPSSLNTIRVVTLSHQGRFSVFGALFRMGAHGSVVDNTHTGGIYAPINVETGTIDIEAIDGQNNHYEYHPDSHKRIKGFKIPSWNKIVETCKEASEAIPNVRFAGWDICINKNGNVEIIEGNHAPDFDGGMQAPLKIGVKYKLADAVQNVMGVNPLKYISVWKNASPFEQISLREYE